jgi:hypothetical protein
MPQAVEPDRSLWPHFAGIYARPERGIVTVEIEGDELMLDWRGPRTVRAPLQALSANRYTALLPAQQRPIYVGFIPEVDVPVQYVLVNRDWYQRVAIDSACES